MTLATVGVILLAGILRYAVGMLWYMPHGLFHKLWLTELGFSADHKFTSKQGDNSGRNGMILGFCITLISTFILALVVWPITLAGTDMLFARTVFVAFVLWIGFQAPIIAKRKIYDAKDTYTWKLFGIDAAHELAGIIVASLVLVYLLQKIT